MIISVAKIFLNLNDVINWNKNLKKLGKITKNKKHMGNEVINLYEMFNITEQGEKIHNQIRGYF